MLKHIVFLKATYRLTNYIFIKFNSLRRYENPYVQWLSANIFKPRKVNKYYEDYLFFPSEIRKVVKRKYPLKDRYILKRLPALQFTLINQKRYVYLNPSYQPSDEIRVDERPYIGFAKGLEYLFDSEEIRSVNDVGCSNGLLIKHTQDLYNVEVRGYEIFNYFKDASPLQVKDKIQIVDLRLPFQSQLADLTICTEVGEHIDPQHIDTFMNNLSKMTNKFLLMSWSSTFPNIDAPPQHICSLPKKSFIKLVLSFGFEISKYNDDLIAEISKQKNLYPWWLESLTLFKKTSKL
jgi:hypothetical protein